MISASEFLYEVVKKRLNTALIDDSFKFCGGSRNTFAIYMREVYEKFANKAANVLEKFIIKEISNDSKKQEIIVEYFKSFLTEYEINECKDIKSIVTKTISKFRNNTNSSNDDTVDIDFYSKSIINEHQNSYIILMLILIYQLV